MSGLDTLLLPVVPGRPAAAAGLRRAAQLRLMAVHAHPDDESSKGAATMARYVRSGVDVMVCTLTGGERGDILNKAMERPGIRANLSSVRRQEMARAREILGVGQQFLGFVDSGLPEGDPLPPLPEGCFALQKPEDATEPLVRAVRGFRPHVMLTYDENGGYPHPDHLMTHQVSVQAFDAAADPDRYPGSGEPWQPLKLYYFISFHKARFAALHEEMERRGLESPYKEWFRHWDDQEWFRRWDDEEWFWRWDDQKWFKRRDHQDRAATRPQLQITTRVPCADFFAVRDQALLAHATQIDPASSWFACPVEVRQAAWPTEDYHLARSLVNTELPEDDLFAGVREMLLVSAAGTPGGRAR
jgi:mycothiol S-conjugate amidase